MAEDLTELQEAELGARLSLCRVPLNELARWLDRNDQKGRPAIPLDASRIAVIITAEEHGRLRASGLL